MNESLRRALYVLLFIFTTTHSFSQWEGANWYFNGIKESRVAVLENKGMVNFHFGSGGLSIGTIPLGNPSIIDNQFNVDASISSPTGQIQFAVVRFDSIVNKDFRYIKSQSGNFNCQWNNSATNIFIPLNGLTPRKYLYFTMSQTFSPLFPSLGIYASLKYSLLDTTLFGNEGGAYFGNRVPPFLKDSLYVSSITAAMHNNKRDIWLLFRDAHNDFYAVLISPCGEMSPIVFSTTIRRTTKRSMLLNMEFDPFSRYITLLEDSLINLHLYHFNNLTGKVNFIQLLDSNTYIQENQSYPLASKLLAFSPDGRYLYRVSNRNFPRGYIYQYDLKDTYSTPGILPPRSQTYPIAVPAAIHPGLDGKTYLFYNTQFLTKVGHVGVISQPNQPYPLNQLDTAAITSPGKMNLDGYGCLPNFLNEFRWPGWKGIQLYISNFTTTSPCIGKSISFIPEDTAFAKKITWDFGDGKRDTSYFPTHVYKDTGTYLVKMRLHLSCYTDSVVKSLKVKKFIKPNLGNDTILPCYTSVELKPNSNYLKYQWNTLDSTKTLIATNSGRYFLKVNDLCGSAIDTVNVIWKTPVPPTLKYHPDFINVSDSCVLNSIVFSIKDTLGIDQIHWNFGDNSYDNKTISPKHSYILPKVYTISVSAKHLCFTDSSTRKITIDEEPKINLGNDTLINCDQPILLEAGIGFKNYKWQDGSNLPTFTASRNGLFYVHVKNSCGEKSDTIEIDYNPIIIPNVFTPNSDGKNDSFIILNYTQGTGSLIVWNRWGDETFKTEKYLNDWSPRNNLSEGIYFYHFETGCESQKGYVQILR